MEKIYKMFLMMGTIIFLVFVFLFIRNQNLQLSLSQKQVRIQEETHMLNLYAEYKANVDSCRQEALSNGKDEQYIRANCLEVINLSLIGKLIREWDKEELLITN